MYSLYEPPEQCRINSVTIDDCIKTTTELRHRFLEQDVIKGAIEAETNRFGQQIWELMWYMLDKSGTIKIKAANQDIHPYKHPMNRVVEELYHICSESAKALRAAGQPEDADVIEAAIKLDPFEIWLCSYLQERRNGNIDVIKFAEEIRAAIVLWPQKEMVRKFIPVDLETDITPIKVSAAEEAIHLAKQQIGNNHGFLRDPNRDGLRPMPKTENCPQEESEGREAEDNKVVA